MPEFRLECRRGLVGREAPHTVGGQIGSGDFVLEIQTQQRPCAAWRGGNTAATHTSWGRGGRGRRRRRRRGSRRRRGREWVGSCLSSAMLQGLPCTLRPGDSSSSLRWNGAGLEGSIHPCSPNPASAAGDQTASAAPCAAVPPCPPVPMCAPVPCEIGGWRAVDGPVLPGAGQTIRLHLKLCAREPHSSLFFSAATALLHSSSLRANGPHGM